jgi:hypothetical protein
MTDTHDAAGEAVTGLVSQRDQLRAWIAKLDQVGGAAVTKVAARVRADYEDRLRRVTEELAAHAESVRGSLEQRREELAAAEERREHAVEALDETRLRHDIGELDEAAWDQARQPLDAELSAAELAVEQARGEVERLDALSGEIEAGARAEQEQPADRGEAEPAAREGAVEPAAEQGFDDGGEIPMWQDPGSDDEGEEWTPNIPADEITDEAPQPAAAEAPEEVEQAPVSGEELASWISEVEAESAGGDTPPDAAEPAAEEAPPAAAAAPAEEWDPFANEFGGTASPATQPGDASRDLAWRDSVQAPEGTPQSAAATPHEDLAFLEDMEAERPAAEQAATDLADDDLAFLEELDRAISGGAQRPATPAPAAPGGGPAPFTGGSGGTGFEADPSDPSGEPRKRGEALLCKECGAINEPQAWYCEICGSEL